MKLLRFPVVNSKEAFNYIYLHFPNENMRVFPWLPITDMFIYFDVGDDNH